MPNQAFDHFTCLESAWIEDCSAVTPALLRVLVSRNKATLKRLCLRWCPNIYREHIEPLMLKGLLEGVTTLSLRAILDVDDSLTPVIIETMPNLKVLDLHDTKITGYTLKQLADAKSPRLETFHVPRVSLDAIEYARSRNIKVLR